VNRFYENTNNIVFNKIKHIFLFLNLINYYIAFVSLVLTETGFFSPSLSAFVSGSQRIEVWGRWVKIR